MALLILAFSVNFNPNNSTVSGVSPMHTKVDDVEPDEHIAQVSL